MDSTVKARPNHYELLGLTPTAGSDEIARAFAREVSRPRAFGGLAAIGIAYETLRNAQKRRAYDASIGLAPEPRPALELASNPYAMHAIVATPHLKSEPKPEPRNAGFITASPTEPKSAFPPEGELALRSDLEALEAERKLGSPPQSELLRRLEEVAMPTFKPTVGGELRILSTDLEPASEVEEPPIAWKRPAAIAGGLVVAVAAIGAIAGLDAGGDAQTAQPETVVTSALPMAKPRPATRAPSSLPTVAALDVPTERRTRPAVAARRIERARVQPQPTGLADLQLDAAPSEPSAAVSQGGQASAEPSGAAVVPASMPIPNATIARTIGRIGYACGEVASTSMIEGEGPGVFKVTCTSGHSYKAAPVRGRYHFRRLSSQ